MLNQLEEVERRFEDLTARLADPKLSTQIDELTKIMKERAKLEEVVRTFREFKKVSAELEEAKKLLAGPDPELRDMAKAELRELEPKLETLDGVLKAHLLPKDPLDGKTLRALLTKLGMQPADLVRRGEPAYKELGLDKKLDDQEALIDAMVRNPVLIERPIVVRGGKARLGRPPEKIEEIL